MTCVLIPQAHDRQFECYQLLCLHSLSPIVTEVDKTVGGQPWSKQALRHMLYPRKWMQSWQIVADAYMRLR